MQRLQIDPRHWAELNRLLDAALDLPVAERDQWLDTLEGEHSALKPQLRELLARAARIETQDFLATLPKLPSDAEQPGAATSPDERAGECVGAYRLVRELGAGGMGSVWLAERLDGLIRRPVALKLPHIASDRVGLAERMDRERSILAALTHPNIARLYDAGVTPQGRPYLALEYVEGKPIDVYCNDRQLGLQERLRLFLQVVNAVAYAHGKLIIHRDLKPANVLVTSEGEVRLLDFGIGKLLDDGVAKATQLTELSGRALTPDYASPEQIRGEPLTTGTDVYSLGVVLYELLTGARPYKLKRDSRGALEDAILQGELEKPSNLVSKSLRKSVKGDLDTILLKALKNKPDERYPTAHALREDIERWLTRRPVLAQPDSRWYRFERFVARNKLGFAAVSSILIAIIAGAAVAVWQARVALAEKDRAEDVKDFIASIFRDASPYQPTGQSLSGRELLQLAGERVRGIDNNRPELRIELLNILGTSLLSLEDLTGAESVLRNASAEARILKPAHAQVLENRRLLAEVYLAQGNTSATRSELEAILPTLRKNARADPEALIRGLLSQVKLENAETQYETAQATAVEALELIETRRRPVSADEVGLLSALYFSYRQRGNEIQALATAERAYQAALRLQKGDESHPTVLSSRFAYAQALADNAKLTQAVAEIDEVLHGTERAFGAANRQFGVRLVSTAEIYVMAGRIQDAQRNADRGLEILSQYHDGESRPWGVATEVRGLTRLAARQGREAAELIGRAHPVLEKHFGASSMLAQRVRRNRAFALALAGDLRTAETEMRSVMESFPIFEPEEFDRNSYFLGVMRRLGRDHEQAVSLLQASLKSLPDKPLAGWERTQIEIELGWNQLELGQHEQANATLVRAVEAMNAYSTSMTPARADALIALARIALAKEAPAGAVSGLEAADRYWRELNPESRWAGEAALWLGRCYLALGRNTEAEEVLNRAARILARSALSSDVRLATLAQQRLATLR